MAIIDDDFLRALEHKLMFSPGSHLSTTESRRWSGNECLMHDIINLVELKAITNDELAVLYRYGHLSAALVEIMKARMQNG